MKIRRDQSYPYRLTQYRAAHAGRTRGLPPLVIVHGYSAEIYGMHGLVHLLADQLSEYALYEYAFETNPQPKANTVSLEIASRELGHELLRVMARDGLSAHGAAFIGHSTGGVVVRRAFVDQASLWSGAKFVFLGTPHHGAPAADVKGATWIADKQARELPVGSDFLWRLNRDWDALPDGAIDRVLSVVGTNSSRTFSPGVPHGMWVAADGVVPAASALLSGRGPAKYFGMFAPLDHSELRDVSAHWKSLQSLSRRWQREVADPHRCLPAVATLEFLRGADTPDLQTHADLWERCVRLLEVIEKDRNNAIVHEMAGYVEAPNGQWRERARTFRGKLVPPRFSDRSDDDLELSYQLREIQIGTWNDPYEMPADYRPPAQPAFLDRLRTLLDESRRFIAERSEGAAILRLEPAAKPFPTLGELQRLVDGVWRPQPLPPGSFAREGARWGTWCLADLPAGTYRARVAHAARRYVAEFAVHACGTTLVDIDGDGLHLTEEDEFCDARSLGGDASAVMRDIAAGIEATSRTLATRSWDIAGEVRPPIIIRP